MTLVYKIVARAAWDAAVAAERAHLVRLRHTPEARAKLGAFLTKS